METLFLPRCQMELIVVLQQLTSNCLKALEQVSVMSVCLSVCLYHEHTSCGFVYRSVSQLERGTLNSVTKYFGHDNGRTTSDC